STTFNTTSEIYAKWIEDITITYNAKGGTVTPSSKTFPPGTAIGELPTPEKVGYDLMVGIVMMEHIKMR
ncbi:MAG: hypothetical protein IKI04_00815, partial [Bacilli bacterium]|nr:hypothetical protein [Bacilli bacterium]